MFTFLYTPLYPYTTYYITRYISYKLTYTHSLFTVSYTLYTLSTPLYYTIYYTAYCIDVEEITHKAGNYKKFDIFIKMLLSSLYKDTTHSNSVYIDLLTYADLELLKARKSVPENLKNGHMSETQNNSNMHDNNNNNNNTATNNTATNMSIITKQHNKRYIILTYTSEFDRVHYPLPLQYNEVPETDNLIRTINRYRHRLKQTNVGKTVLSPGGGSGGNISIQTNNE